jgi:hypothetical protein
MGCEPLGHIDCDADVVPLCSGDALENIYESLRWRHDPLQIKIRTAVSMIQRLGKSAASTHKGDVLG